MLAHHYLSALEFGRSAGQDVSSLATPARLALREAGERAFGLIAFEQAGRFFSAALDLWPEDDPDRPRLLLRLAYTRSYGRPWTRRTSRRATRSSPPARTSSPRRRRC